MSNPTWRLEIDLGEGEPMRIGEIEPAQATAIGAALADAVGSGLDLAVLLSDRWQRSGRLSVSLVREKGRTQ